MIKATQCPGNNGSRVKKARLTKSGTEGKGLKSLAYQPALRRESPHGKGRDRKRPPEAAQAMAGNRRKKRAAHADERRGTGIREKKIPGKRSGQPWHAAANSKGKEAHSDERRRTGKPRLKPHGAGIREKPWDSPPEARRRHEGPEARKHRRQGRRRPRNRPTRTARSRTTRPGRATPAGRRKPAGGRRAKKIPAREGRGVMRIKKRAGSFLLSPGQEYHRRKGA